MKLCILVVASLAFTTVEAAAVNPIQKVLTMMTEMKAKGELMMQEEAKTYATYSEWVSDQERKLGFELKTGDSDSEQLLASIAKADNDVDQLSSAISELEGEIQTATNEKQSATELRTKQHEEYVTVSSDYSESVDALNRAIQTMQSKNYDVPQAMALMQKMAET
jgi:chromosome segregation ATPase